MLISRLSNKTLLPLLLTPLMLFTACSSQAVEAKVAPTSSFSEEEMLHRAKDAYQEYVQTFTSIVQAGGANPERMQAIVSPELYLTERESYQQFSQDAIHGVGQASFFNFQLENFSEHEVTALACLDFSQFRIFNSENVDVTPAERSETTAFKLRWSFSGNQKLVLEESEIWSDQNICSQ